MSREVPDVDVGLAELARAPRILADAARLPVSEEADVDLSRMAEVRRTGPRRRLTRRNS